jgi:2'-5' RNA ligase
MRQDEPMTRLFIAVWPSATAIDQLIALPRAGEPGVRWVPPQNWHITLRFLGDADVDHVAELLATTELPRAVAHLGPRIERLHRRQVVVPVSGVDELAHHVRSATAQIGEHDRRPFRGHLTVARTAPDASATIIGTGFDAAFSADAVALVASQTLPDGAVYTTVATFATVTGSE